MSRTTREQPEPPAAPRRRTHRARLEASRPRRPRPLLSRAWEEASGLAPHDTAAAVEKARAAEERTAIVRFLVIGLNIITYWGWLAPTGLGGTRLAAAVSVVAALYGAYALLGQPYLRFPVLLTAAWTTVTDGLLITLWLLATGGFASPYYLLWYLSIVAVTFRFDWRAPLGAAVLYSACYLALVAAEGQLAAHAVDMAIRAGYILLCGGLGSLLAHESARAFEARVQMGAKVREAERFHALAEASNEALMVSADGMVLECNEAYAQALGLPREGLVGRRLAELAPPGPDGRFARQALDPGGPAEVWRDGPHGRRLLRIEGRPIGYLGRPARLVSIRDVTGEREAERLAGRTETQLQLAVEAGQVGTWDLDLGTGELAHNPRLGQLLGHGSFRGIEAEHLFEHVLEEDRPAAAQALESAVRGGPLDAEFRVRWPDGSFHWVSMQGQARRAADGHVIGLVGVARDTTTARAAEEARLLAQQTAYSGQAQEAKDRLAAVVDSSIDGILTKDLEGRITSWNPACEALFGYTAEEAIGRPSTILAVPGREEDEKRLLASVRSGKAVRVRETERVRKDGSRVWVSVTASPLRNAGGEVVGCAAIKRDITAVRALEKERGEAREAMARLAAVVDSSSDGILTKDLQGRITSWNPGCETLFGYTADEVMGRPITMLYPKGKEAEEEGILERIRAGEQVRIREAERVRKDGKVLRVSLSASPLRDALGRIVGAAAINRDVTEARAVEQERAEAKERLLELARLQDVNRFKTQFVNTAAHELRTPLLPLRMQLDLMMSDDADPPTPAQREAMEVMRRNLERLGALVEDLLTIARSEAGRIELRLEAVGLAPLLRSAGESFQAVAKRRGVRFAVRPAQAVVLADAARISQVLANLLGNAFKFTPEGGEVRLEADAAGPMVRVTVADSGRGIAEENLARLFQPFVQVHDMAMTEPGSGLGLYICKQIVELHGGAIGVESAGIGKGAAFWFTLPRPPEAGPERPEPAATPGAAAATDAAAAPAPSWPAVGRGRSAP